MIYQPSDVLQRLDQPVGHESAVWIRILSMLIHTAALWDYPLLHTAVCANSHFRLTYSHSGSACTQLAVRIRSSVLLICTATLWIRTLNQLICTDGCVNKEPSPAYQHSGCVNSLVHFEIGRSCSQLSIWNHIFCNITAIMHDVYGKYKLFNLLN